MSDTQTCRATDQRWPHHARMRVLAIAGLLFAGTVALGLSSEAPAFAANGACDGAAGVTVVVDFTELGGTIETGCATGDPATGRAALLAAGFTAADSQPGLLCAINTKPDPCPATFQGSYWSYWHSAPNGQWTSYQVGADSSHPVPGELEGWRYNDGAVGPGIAPAAVASTSQPTPTATTTSVAPTFAAPSADAANNALVFTTLGFAAAIVLVVILFLIRSRRRKATRSSGIGPDGGPATRPGNGNENEHD